MGDGEGSYALGGTGKGAPAVVELLAALEACSAAAAECSELDADDRAALTLRWDALCKGMALLVSGREASVSDLDSPASVTAHSHSFLSNVCNNWLSSNTREIPVKPAQCMCGKMLPDDYVEHYRQLRLPDLPESRLDPFLRAHHLSTAGSKENKLERVINCIRREEVQRRKQKARRLRGLEKSGSIVSTVSNSTRSSRWARDSSSRIPKSCSETSSSDSDTTLASTYSSLCVQELERSGGSPVRHLSAADFPKGPSPSITLTPVGSSLSIGQQASLQDIQEITLLGSTRETPKEPGGGHDLLGLSAAAQDGGAQKEPAGEPRAPAGSATFSESAGGAAISFGDSVRTIPVVGEETVSQSSFNDGGDSQRSSAGAVKAAGGAEKSDEGALDNVEPSSSRASLEQDRRSPRTDPPKTRGLKPLAAKGAQKRQPEAIAPAVAVQPTATPRRKTSGAVLKSRHEPAAAAGQPQQQQQRVPLSTPRVTPRVPLSARGSTTPKKSAAAPLSARGTPPASGRRSSGSTTASNFGSRLSSTPTASTRSKEATSPAKAKSKK